MNKQEAKRLLEAGEIQIENDAPDKLEVLKELFCWAEGGGEYYIKDDWSGCSFKNLPIIKLSEITEEDVVYQFFFGGEWCDIREQVRIKPQTDYTNEIEALQNKAKENNEKVVIVFEKL